MKMLSRIQQVVTILLVVCQCSYAQENTTNSIWHNKSYLFLLKMDGYYLVEDFYFPQKYSKAYIDTLLPSNSASDTFTGKKFLLYLENNQQKLTYNNKRKKKIKIKPANDEELWERNKRHNFNYYRSYERKISEYSRLLSETNSDKYQAFNNNRDEMYKKQNELSIEAFRQYFDEFINKYNLE